MKSIVQLKKGKSFYDSPTSIKCPLPNRRLLLWKRLDHRLKNTASMKCLPFMATWSTSRRITEWSEINGTNTNQTGWWCAILGKEHSQWDNNERISWVDDVLSNVKISIVLGKAQSSWAVSSVGWFNYPISTWKIPLFETYRSKRSFFP